MWIFRIVDIALLCFSAQHPMVFQNILLRYNLLGCGPVLNPLENSRCEFSLLFTDLKTHYFSHLQLCRNMWTLFVVRFGCVYSDAKSWWYVWWTLQTETYTRTYYWWRRNRISNRYSNLNFICHCKWNKPERRSFMFTDNKQWVSLFKCSYFYWFRK
jgi:hypothetical protein